MRVCSRGPLRPLMIIMLAVLGCGPKSRGITECVLAQDQSATLKGYWGVTPIPWALSYADFVGSSSEQQIMADSVKVWNNFTKVSFGYEILKPAPVGTSSERAGISGVTLSTVLPAVGCGKTLLNDSATQFVNPVVVHKIGNWSTVHPGAGGVIALTTTCQLSGTPNFNLAFIEFNVQDYWASGKMAPDVKSIAVHEFGHLLGLDHSCQAGSTVNGMPDCDSSRTPRLYKSAVLFPQFAADEVRSKLNSNDMGRTNCLYKGQTK